MTLLALKSLNISKEFKLINDKKGGRIMVFFIPINTVGQRNCQLHVTISDIINDLFIVYGYLECV